VAQWLLITCGYPFSGKKTLSNAVAGLLGMTVIGVDEQLELTGADIGAYDWLRAYRSAYGQARRALAAGESVIFDSVGHTRKNRDRLRRIAAQAGARSLIVRLGATEAEARERLVRNRANPVRVQVPSEGFAEIAASFQPPMDDEEQVCFDPHLDLRSWVVDSLRPVLDGQEIRG
jgi:predicted kinase